jgi:hypothetical protein
MPSEGYMMFSKPDTKLAGGIVLVKEEELIQPKVDSEGRGQITNRMTMRVEEVGAALKSVEAAGGKIIRYVYAFVSVIGVSDAPCVVQRRRSEMIWAMRECFVTPRETLMVCGP